MSMALHDAPLLPPVASDAPLPNPRSRSQWRALLLGGLFGIVLAGGGALLLRAIDRGLLHELLAGFSGAAARWILLPLALYLVILAHEVGHLLGGWFVGFRFTLLVVGPVRVERSAAGRIRMRLNKDLASAGGLAASVPADQHDLAGRFARVVAGGPLASLALSMVCGAFAFSMDQPSLLRATLASMAGLSLAIFFATAAPMQTGMYLTDGARLLQLLRRGPASVRDAALLTAGAANTIGTPVAAWDRQTIAKMLTPEDGSIFELQGRWYAYMWLVAHGALNEARVHLERALAITGGLPTAMRTSLQLEHAFLRALVDRAMPERAAGPPAASLVAVPAHQRARVSAAEAMARGDVAEAKKQIAAARSVLQGSGSAASAAGQWELDRLAEIESALESR